MKRKITTDFIVKTGETGSRTGGHGEDEKNTQVKTDAYTKVAANRRERQKVEEVKNESKEDVEDSSRNKENEF